MNNVKTIDELNGLKTAIINPHEVHKQNLTALERFALWITKHVGTMGFFFIIAVWTLLWLSWNTLAPAELKFDPSPAFVLWLFISNMIQLSLLPLIMIGQNLQSRESDIRSKSDYEINIKAEKEVETIIKYLQDNSEMLKQIISNIEKDKK